MRRLVTVVVWTAFMLAAAGCDLKFVPGFTPDDSPSDAAATPPAAEPAESGGTLYAPTPSPVLSPAPAAPRSPAAREPIVICDCHLAVIDKQDVPSLRDGVLLFIGTPVGPGESVPPDRLLRVRVGGEERLIRRLLEDDTVQAGQLLAQLDDRIQRDDYAIKEARVIASKADLAASEKTRDEARSIYESESRMSSAGSGITTSRDLGAAKLTWERYKYEVISKSEAVHLAELERAQARTVLEMHAIHATIPGIVKAVYKRPGEAVKSYEPVLQIQDLSRLRAEGLVDGQYLGRLHKGMRVVLEPARAKGPEQVLVGHLQPVTCVAVSKGPNSLIVSAGEDGTVRVWDRTSRRERRVWPHGTAVRAVACAPPEAAGNWCLSGAADGKVRLWDLDADTTAPVREFKGRHHGAVTCVAFSPDGKQCATGGDDRDILLWDTATGELHYRLPAGHCGAVTSLQFTPQARLISAGADNTVRFWTLGDHGSRLARTLDQRSGDVACLGASRDGRQVLFDQGKALRILSVPDCLTLGVLQNSAAAANFTTFALFSPDAGLVLTAGAAEGRVQVWRAPGDGVRGHEVCQLVSPAHSETRCAAFAPDGSFIVTGTRDRQVLVWPTPARDEVEQQLTAEIALVERAVESTAGQVRIWADLPNPDGRLLPGAAVTMVIDPGQ
jgi:WD40 repeat protein